MMRIRLDGSPRYAMFVQVGGAFLIIFIDWYMVYPMDMGIKGVSIATSIACIAAGSRVLIYFMFFSSQLKFYRLKATAKSLRLSLRNIGYMIKIGIPTFLAEISIGITMIAGNFMFLKYLGEDGVAAFSIGCYLFPIMFSISEAVALASQPIISFNYGARQFDRVSKTLKLAVATAIVCGLCITGAMAFGTKWLTMPFLSADAPAFGMALSGLPLLGTCAIFFAINITFIGYYQSTEKALRSSIYTVLKGIIFLIPSFVFLPRIIGIQGLWLAVPVAELLTLTVVAAAFYLNKKR
ncbi:MAG: MATE family efflux transporter, partial [Muribaculaceae bacterium]|nr:MATE family efflux transporter [Muribaculaceae bacterium]